MKAGLIAIGDELLIGQTINTNLAWLGKTLNDAGVELVQSTAIKDSKTAIFEAVDRYVNKFDLILITGGLGPTNDDITKATLTDYFGTFLELNQNVLDRIKARFNRRGMEMPPTNKQQAYLPKNTLIIDNHKGTASGMWFEKNNKIIISLPGVPYEMKAMITDSILPSLTKRFNLKPIHYQTLMVQGISESALSERISNWEKKLDNEGLHLAYLPSPGFIKLRIDSPNGNKDKGKINSFLNELKSELPEYIYGENEQSIFEVVGEILRKEKKTLSTVESCSGGSLAHAFIQYPGASDFFMGGIVTYANNTKMQLVGVTEQSLKKWGAVSEEVAKQMAIGGKEKLNTDYTIAVTGIAGPSGGTNEKPVGTVWIAIATPNSILSQQFIFGENRSRNIQMTQHYAANLLRKIILGIN